MAVGAIDRLMHYYEQCQLTTADDIENLSTIKHLVDYMHLASQKQASVCRYFKL